MNDSIATIFVVDDDVSILSALSRLLRATGFHVRKFDSPQTFLETCNPTTHGCIVTDLNMPGLNGLELQAALAAKDIMLPIIFITGYGDIPTSVRALKSGAIDFLPKPFDDEALLKAVRSAVDIDRTTRRTRAEAAEIRGRLSRLTPREYEVLVHVISGRLNKQAGAEMGTTEKTIKVHRARMMEKMQVSSVAELVHLVAQVGITVKTWAT